MDITPDIALNILDLATDPRNAGKHVRSDYANCEMAIASLREHLKVASAAIAELAALKAVKVAEVSAMKDLVPSA